MNQLLVIAGRPQPVITDFATTASEGGKRRLVVITTSDGCRASDDSTAMSAAERATCLLPERRDMGPAALVLFLGRKPDPAEKGLIDGLAQAVPATGISRVCIISTFKVHFGDRRAAETEEYALNRFRSVLGQCVVLRPSHVITRRARCRLERLCFSFPLVPSRFRTCFLEESELFQAIERSLTDPGLPRERVVTLLGQNRPWRALLEDSRGDTSWHRALTALSRILSLLQIGRLLGLFWSVLEMVRPGLGSWNFDTLQPASTRELLALYNRHNYEHVKVVGYNNGVNHFGQRYPGRTVLSTTGCNRLARINCNLARFDGGVTVHQASAALARAGKELYVLPNYSYVAIGTSFFVPIHGSAGQCSTMGETIEKVVLYDPVIDRIITSRRAEPAFRDAIYDLNRPLLLLRLQVRVRDASRYYMKRQTLTDPASRELIDALSDKLASHVEIRKSRSASRTVDIFKYYTQQSLEDSAALEFPRDSIGKVWDRIEENACARTLFHSLMRRFAFHVELFLTHEEFEVFWETHSRQALAKIQLRYIKRDGFPHSPFRERDCISADLVMLRKHRRAFEIYIKQYLPKVRCNPGKHSM
jgi:hypothetical protein